METQLMEFLHVGLKVDDIHKSSRLYQTLFGIDWEPIKEHYLDDVTLNGEIEACRTLVTHGKTASGFEIEMIQVLEGHTADEVALGSREGLSHFGFTVPDLDVAIKEAEERGLRKVSEYRSEYVDFVFFDGGGLGGALAQLIHFNQPRQLVSRVRSCLHKSGDPGVRSQGGRGVRYRCCIGDEDNAASVQLGAGISM